MFSLHDTARTKMKKKQSTLPGATRRFPFRLQDRKPAEKFPAGFFITHFHMIRKDFRTFLGIFLINSVVSWVPISLKSTSCTGIDGSFKL